MNKTVAVMAVAAVLVLTSAAWAGEAVRLGFVDLQEALNLSQAGQRSKVELEGIIKEKQARIDQMIARRDRLKEEFDRQASILSEEASSQRMDDLDALNRDIERTISDSNAEVQKLQRQKEVAILKDLDAIITSLGQSEGYTLILPADVILFSGEGTDLTKMVIERYDAQGAGGEADSGKPVPDAPNEDAGEERQ